MGSYLSIYNKKERKKNDKKKGKRDENWAVKAWRACARANANHIPISLCGDDVIGFHIHIYELDEQQR